MNGPLPPMLSTPGWQRRDSDHLTILSIFHFVVAGLALFGIAFLVFHYFVMSAFMSPEFWKSQKGGHPPPAELMPILAIVYVVVAILMVLGGVLNLLSGIFLRRRCHRLFSMIVAGLNCLNMPLGTALGIFTILILSRDSVRRMYEESHDVTGTAGLGS
jgi:hypothetical protein